jgi:hypothetical protein
MWGPGRGKNAHKIPVLLLRGNVHGNEFSPALARCEPDFISRGRRVEASLLLNGQSETF